MRFAFERNGRFDCPRIRDVQLNLECRDEMIPVLRALQYLHGSPKHRDKIMKLIEEDVSRDTDPDQGRPGLSYWQICVLAAIRKGCNLNYDRMQNCAENHWNLRHIMGIGDWETPTFNWRLIRDNIALLRPDTIDAISAVIVEAGHELEPDAAKKVRVDSSVVESNIHHPTDSSLIRDAVNKAIPSARILAEYYGLSGWRQHEHLQRRIKEISREIDCVCSKKGPHYYERSKPLYKKLIRLGRSIAKRCRKAIEAAQDTTEPGLLNVAGELLVYTDYIERLCNNAFRRVLQGQSVPAKEKIFSIYEPHTQIYKRGKAAKPVQFGRLTVFFEDAQGFIIHHRVLEREEQDRDIAVKETREAQRKMKGRIESISFDRGFHSPLNQEQLARLVENVCLPKMGAKQAAQQDREASEEFRQARQRHSGVESAIGCLQSGNGLKRCVDRTEVGFKRYVAMAVLGRNLHVLGKLLIKREAPKAEAAYSARN